MLYIDVVVGLLHPVVRGDAGEVSEIYVGSIFRVDSGDGGCMYLRIAGKFADNHTM
jgi:hypothetical protein